MFDAVQRRQDEIMRQIAANNSKFENMGRDLSTAAGIAGWTAPTAVGALAGAMSAPKNKGLQSTLRGAGLGAALHAGASLGARAGSALSTNSPGTGGLVGGLVGGLGSTLAAQYLLPRVEDEENTKKEKAAMSLYEFGSKLAQVTNMTYDPDHPNVKKLKQQHPDNWQQVMARSQGLSDASQAKPVKKAQSACSPCAMPNAPTNKKPYTSASPAVTDASQKSEEIGKPPVTETEHSEAEAKLPEEGAKSAHVKQANPFAAFGKMVGQGVAKAAPALMGAAKPAAQAATQAVGGAAKAAPRVIGPGNMAHSLLMANAKNKSIVSPAVNSAAKARPMAAPPLPPPPPPPARVAAPASAPAPVNSSGNGVVNGKWTGAESINPQNVPIPRGQMRPLGFSESDIRAAQGANFQPIRRSTGGETMQQLSRPVPGMIKTQSAIEFGVKAAYGINDIVTALKDSQGIIPRTGEAIANYGGPRNALDTVIDAGVSARNGLVSGAGNVLQKLKDSQGIIPRTGEAIANYGGPRNALDTVIDAGVSARNGVGSALSGLNNARIAAGRHLGEMWAAGGNDGGRGYQGPPGSTPQVSGKVGPSPTGATPTKPEAPSSLAQAMEWMRSNPGYTAAGGLGALGLGGLLYHLNSQKKKKKDEGDE